MYVNNLFQHIWTKKYFEHLLPEFNATYIHRRELLTCNCNNIFSCNSMQMYAKKNMQQKHVLLDNSWSFIMRMFHHDILIPVFTSTCSQQNVNWGRLPTQGTGFASSPSKLHVPHKKMSYCRHFNKSIQSHYSDWKLLDNEKLAECQRCTTLPQVVSCSHGIWSKSS